MFVNMNPELALTERRQSKEMERSARPHVRRALTCGNEKPVGPGTRPPLIQWECILRPNAVT